MDLSNPWVLFSGLFIGAIGAGLFMYGRKAESPRCLFAGVALCIMPYFVSSLIVLWLLTAGTLGGLYALARNE